MFYSSGTFGRPVFPARKGTAMTPTRSVRAALRQTVLAGFMLVLSLSGAGCGDPVPQAVDHDNQTKSAPLAPLLAADRAFAADVARAAPGERGRIWSSWFAPDGKQFLPGRVVAGHEAIAALMTSGLASPGYTLTWAPDMGGIAGGGDFGWTSGRYESRNATPADTTSTFGRYLTLWEKQPDGTWKAVLDTGVPDPAE